MPPVQGRHRRFVGDRALAAELKGKLAGEVLFDPFSRGRYSTDASIYQIEPIGVVVPKNTDDVLAAMEVADRHGLPLLPRGGGTSQCGQTVGEAIVVDVSKHMTGVLDFDPEGRRVTVEPGLVLDQLNAFLKPHGLMFPVDISTGSRATIGGMTGNNSCGARSLRYGTMRDNVLAIDAFLANGEARHFGILAQNAVPPGADEFTESLLALGRREAEEIKSRFPQLMRRVGGYNIDALTGNRPINLSHLLVGSEGTLAFSKSVTLALAPIPKHKVLGICHFDRFYDAMAAAKHIVALDPVAVELVDRTMIELSRDIAAFRDTVSEVVQGAPDALLLVEFAGEDPAALRASLQDLQDLMADLGAGLVQVTDPAKQSAVWEVRKAGLNIMMSMKGDGKPVSFIEDCAVSLDDLADYTDRLTAVFEKHGTQGTWYAHASVGCLHVRPVLNLKLEADAKKMRAIAEEAFAMVREYKGSHSGEHGDGLVRSEFHETMFGKRMVENFAEVKRSFDPEGRMNPGKIVDPPAMDDRTLFRFKPGYRSDPIDSGLDWSAWGGFAGAVEMCNNNGACRKRDAAVMCPSYRVTGDEAHVTRGRANSLRLALSGQLGPDALASDDMGEAIKLCVSCKGCKRECPTGVDMARMKIEVLHQRAKAKGYSLRDRVVGHLPRYAPWAARLAPLLNLRDRLPGGAGLSEKLLGFAAERPLPLWRRDPFKETAAAVGPEQGQEVVLFTDCFGRYFEPEIPRDAVEVLQAAGCRVHLLRAAAGERPLCCGRSYLSVGMLAEAKAEAERLAAALAPFVARGLPVLGLEPACLFTLRDELPALLPGPSSQDIASRALLIEEFFAGEGRGRLDALPLRAPARRRALLHGHCHQKAFGAMAAVQQVLAAIPELEVETVTSSCCGMAGSFGYMAETHKVSLAMGEASLLPAVRQADSDTAILADGTSCRHQIRDGSGRRASHVVNLLKSALATDKRGASHG